MRRLYIFLNISLIMVTLSITAGNESILPIYKSPAPTASQTMQRGWDNMRQGACDLHVRLDDDVDPGQCCSKIIKGTTNCLYGITQLIAGTIIHNWDTHPTSVSASKIVESFSDNYNKNK